MLLLNTFISKHNFTGCNVVKPETIFIFAIFLPDTRNYVYRWISVDYRQRIFSAPLTIYVQRYRRINRNTELLKHLCLDSLALETSGPKELDVSLCGCPFSSVDETPNCEHSLFLSGGDIRGGGGALLTTACYRKRLLKLRS